MARETVWYMDTVIYGVDVGAFLDSDGDGVGDLNGLIERLPYLAELGVRCLWMLPFYPSPNQDNGYDVSDHYGVEPSLGSPGEFVRLVRAAQDHGIRVIVDLVANHTSDKHPWFQEACRNPDSKYRSYYIWADEPPDDPSQKTIFPGEEESVWRYHEEAGAYYYHLFYRFEPSLNWANPEVHAEVHEIIEFWLQLGVAGFRVDAAPHLIEEKGHQDHEDPHALLRELRRIAEARRGDVALVAETDVDPEHLDSFFGGGKEMNILYNFLLDNYLFLAFARGEAEPIARALKLLPPRPPRCQWANFLRNLDELDLERLSEGEREEVFRAFAPDEEMRIYGRGIRRRLAPMFGGNRARLELAYSLLLSMPGIPLLIYGDEIGMGDDLAQQGRWSVRSPMQWSSAPNGGFSIAEPDSLTRPVISSGAFSYRNVNVAAQHRDPDSFLNWMRRAVKTRRECPEIGTGEYTVLDSPHPAVLVHRFDLDDGVVLLLHNLGNEECRIAADYLRAEEGAVELLVDRHSPPWQSGEMVLAPYGYRWLRVKGFPWYMEER